MYYRENDKVVSLDGKSNEDKVENFTATKKPIQWYVWILFVIFVLGMLAIIAQAFGVDLNKPRLRPILKRK